MPWYDEESLRSFLGGHELPVLGVEVVAHGVMWPDTDKEDDFVLRCDHRQVILRFPKRHEQTDPFGNDTILEMVECRWCGRASPVAYGFAPVFERITLANLSKRAAEFYEADARPG